jgi:pimeloyl-ACP methyl ester carboxylesterase
VRTFVFGRPVRTLAVGVAALVALTACTATQADDPWPSASAPFSSAPADLAAFYGQQVRWSQCPDDGEGFFGGGDDTLECATITVPRDYDDLGAGTLELAALRRPGRDATQSLLLNPGGPGGSAVGYARAATAVLTPELVDAYDVVGVDPRGVGQSTPVDCVDDATIDEFLALDGTPDTPEEEQAIADASAQWGPGCQSRSPQVAPHVDTIAAARDMDIVRAVLGDEQLNFLGKSYGTFLGATYAELFPDRVGRMVLDGVLPSSLDADELSIGQAKAFDVALRRFVADCVTQEDCPLPRDEAAGVARIQQFLDELDAAPIPGVGDRMLTEGAATYAIVSYLYAPPTDWELLRFGLEAAFAGDGSVLMDLMDDRIERNPDGSFANNANEAFPAVSCLDRPGVGGIDHARELAAQWAVEAPLLGEYFAWATLSCWDWPMGPGTAEAAGEPPVIRAQGAAPILVVSTTYDPATPHEWGLQVADELADATLLTLDGDGHTAYTSGSSCIDRAVDAYLLRGELPAEGTVCRADADGGGTGA